MSKLNKLIDKATPGIWRAHKLRYPIQKRTHMAILAERAQIDDGGRVVAQYLTPKDAALIVYLKNNAERLLAVVDAAEEARKTFSMLTHTDAVRNTNVQTAWTHAVTNEAKLRAALRALDESA